MTQQSFERYIIAPLSPVFVLIAFGPVPIAAVFGLIWLVGQVRP